MKKRISSTDISKPISSDIVQWNCQYGIHSYGVNSFLNIEIFFINIGDKEEYAIRINGMQKKVTFPSVEEAKKALEHDLKSFINDIKTCIKSLKHVMTT
jgi:hypothetical protein